MSTSTALHNFPPFYACYLLRSLKPKYTNRTYIGSTPNPARRIRQHNGELTAGAKKTSRYRPWEMVAIVYGFPSQVAALQFEWAWQNPHLSRQMSRKESDEAAAAAATRSPSKRRRAGSTPPTSATKSSPTAARRGPKLNVASQLANLHRMLTRNAYRRWPLHIKVFNADVWMIWEKQCGLHRPPTSKLPPPLELSEWITAELDLARLIPGDPNVPEVQAEASDPEGASQTSRRKRASKAKDDVKARQPLSPVQGGIQSLDVLDRPMQALAATQLQQLASQAQSCTVCRQRIDLSQGKMHAQALVCPGCQAAAHLPCLATSFLKQESVTPDARSWIPVQGQCPSCKSQLQWPLLVKAAAFRRQMQQAGANTLVEMDEALSSCTDEADGLSNSLSDDGSFSSATSALGKPPKLVKKPRQSRRVSRSPSLRGADLSLILESDCELPAAVEKVGAAARVRKARPDTTIDLSGLPTK